MNQWSSQDSGSAAGRGNSGNNFDFNGIIILRDLVYQSRHAVNPGIPAAYHGNLLSFQGFLHCQSAPLHLFFHRRRQQFFMAKPFLYQININGVSRDHIAFFQSLQGSSCCL